MCHLLISKSLQWRHNERDGVSNHWRLQVCSTVSSSADHRKHQSSVSLACVRGIHRWPVNYLHKGPVTRKLCLALLIHVCGVIMGAMASLITSLTSVCWTVHSGADQRKHQSAASLTFVQGIHPVTHEEIKQILLSLQNSATGWDDIAPAYSSCLLNLLYSPCQLYAIFLCLRVSFLINWKLQIWSLCINQMTQCILITPDLCLCYVCYLKCLRELCILDYLHSWKLSKYRYCINTSTASGGNTLHIWLLWS